METAERLTNLLKDPGFTPKTKDVPGLVALYEIADDALATRIDSALAHKPDAARAAAITCLESAPEATRVRACRLLARLGSEEAAVSALILRLDDEAKRVRRAAARALGNMQNTRIENALCEAWGRYTDADERKVIADALAKTGAERALAILKEATSKTDDALLDEKSTRAQIAIERSMKREERAEIVPARAPKAPVAIAWKCRDGIEELLAREVAAFAPLIVSPGRVVGMLSGPLQIALVPRLATEIAFAIPAEKAANGDVVGAVNAALTGEFATRIFDAFSPRGDVTVRVSWSDGGHRRKESWALAEQLQASKTRVRNDPRDATWEASVRVRQSGVHVELTPKSLQDTRFLYRVRDVPAASHPTLAAALAMVAEPESGDVVWDPFCGSGAELIECGRLAEGITLIGTDTDETALDAARANLAAANLTATLAREDALTFSPPRVPTIIVTNPPMGRRVHRSAGLGEMLDAFVLHAAKILPRDGALVWLAPQPEAARATGTAAGLNVTYARRVDLGGFFAELMRFEKKV